MFDELKIGLSTKLMRGIVSKLISKLVQEKLGYKVDIQLNGVQVEMKEDRVHLHLNVDADLDKNDFVDILKNIGLE